MPSKSLGMTLTAVLGLLLTAAAGQALVVPKKPAALAEKEFQHPDLHIPTAYQLLAELPAPDAAAAHQDLDELGFPADGARLDRRGGRWGTLLPAVPLLPGDGVGNRLQWSDLGFVPPSSSAELERAAVQALLDFVAAHERQLRLDPVELASGGTAVASPDGETLFVHVPRTVGGLPVRGSYLGAVISHGNLVLFGTHRWGDIASSVAPQLTAEQAAEAARSHLGPFVVNGSWGKTELELVPLARGQNPRAEAVGQGYVHRLAWVVRPRLERQQVQIELLVDALSGEVLSALDTHHYATDRNVQGGVYPLSNDGVFPDGIEQAGWPMPFETVATATGTVTTDSGGNLPGCFDGNITSDLDGQFIRMSDGCGAIGLTGSGDLDFGTSGGDDCVTPGFGGAGNTHSSRTGFYELNRIKEMARGQLPGNAWLASKLTANMNINSTCNAFWNGSTVNFYRSGGGCANTGEIAAVFDHEWGHGMDDNDANPSISSPGEGIADIYAALRLNNSCIGRGFFDTGTCGGYGDPCLSCTGIRDIDFAQRSTGLPHDVAWIDANCPFGFGTPCGGATHCEGAVYAEAVWDLFNRDLTSAPFNMNSNTALEVATRLTYLGGGAVGTWFQCTTPFGGCSASGGYLNFLAADDDNGTLADGTPHMSAIFAAFDRHGIACNTPAVVNGGCAGTPTVAPAVSVTPGYRSATLSWGAVAGASKYQIFRTDGVAACAFGKIRVGETAGTSFTDSGLQNGRPYSYVVIPTAGNNTCMGPASACDTVVPAGPDPCGGPGGTAVQFGSDTSDEIVRTVALTGFTNPIVVVGPPSHNGGQPAVTRTFNITASSFQHVLQEWDYLDGNHTNETVGYLAMEAGTGTLGTLPAEAGAVSLGTGWSTVTFSQTFPAAPVVLTQVASNNDPSAVTTRVRNVTATSFQMRLQEEEAADGVHATETVHFIAVAPGSATGDAFNVQVGTTGTAVTHAWFPVAFGPTAGTPVFVAGQQTTAGGNTAAVRHRNLTTTGVEVEIEEEQSLDTEVSHVAENVGFVVLD